MATRPLSPAQLEQRRAAGRASYQSLLRRIITAHWPNADRAAQALTGARRCRGGFSGRRGVTSRYIIAQAHALGLT